MIPSEMLRCNGKPYFLVGFRKYMSSRFLCESKGLEAVNDCSCGSSFSFFTNSLFFFGRFSLKLTLVDRRQAQMVGQSRRYPLDPGCH